jgi:hypothetical protein
LIRRIRNIKKRRRRTHIQIDIPNNFGSEEWAGGTYPIWGGGGGGGLGVSCPIKYSYFSIFILSPHFLVAIRNMITIIRMMIIVITNGLKNAPRLVFCMNFSGGSF